MEELVVDMLFALHPEQPLHHRPSIRRIQLGPELGRSLASLPRLVRPAHDV